MVGVEYARFDSVRSPAPADLATVLEDEVRHGTQVFAIFDPPVKGKVMEALAALRASWTAGSGRLCDVGGERARGADGFWHQVYAAYPGANAGGRSVAALRDLLAIAPSPTAGAPTLWMWTDAHRLRKEDPVFFGHAMPALSEGLAGETGAQHLAVMRRQPREVGAGLVVSYEWSPKSAPVPPTLEPVVRELFGTPKPDFLAMLPMRVVHLRE